MAKKGFILAHTELDERMVERLKESGLDLLGVHPGGGIKAAELLDELIEYLNDPRFYGMLDELEKSGFEIEYELHGLNWLLTKSVLDCHPDWKRVNSNGERVTDYNFCASSEDALNYITDRSYYLATLLKQKSHRYNIWMDDVRDGHCHCEKCKSLSPSDQMLIFCHAVLRGLRKYDPEATQSYLAYMDTIKVPEKVAPEEGIFLEFAPIDRWRPGGNDAEFEYIKPLIEFFGAETSKVLEYWVDNSLFSGWKKPPKKCVLDRERMKRDIKMYREAGFGDITSFGLYLDSEYTALHGEFSIKEYAECMDEPKDV
ncbi:MAG: DUF4838 domain-containing protein [Clostridia bacterium]|nr:DUF4838 domain-containing protein [Clostridia bacterium]